MKKVIAPINPDTLSKARIAAGFQSIESAIQAISFLKKDKNGHEKLKAWEKGERDMSLSQAKQFAHAYNIPYTHLYMVPEIFQQMVPDIYQIADLRREDDRNLTPNMIRFLREVIMRQNWLREIKPLENQLGENQLGGNQLEKNELEGNILRENKISHKDIDFTPRSASKIANWYRSVLFHDGRMLTDHLKEWIDKIETVMRVNVMQSRYSHINYKVESELSGAAFCDEYVPVIALNGTDNRERRLFALVYELAHITHAGSGISKVDYRLSGGYGDKREAWCHQVAAETLMPEDIFRSLWEEADSSNDPLLKYKQIRKALGVSLFAAILRASRLELINESEAERLLQMIKNKPSHSLQNQEKKAKNYFERAQKLVARDRAGPAMTKLALQSYDEGRLSARDLHNIFGVKLNHLPKIAEQVGYQLVRWHGGGV